jgi:hypothetical protein
MTGFEPPDGTDIAFSNKKAYKKLKPWIDTK